MINEHDFFTPMSRKEIKNKENNQEILIRLFYSKTAGTKQY